MPTVHPSHANGKRCPHCDTFKPASAFSFKDRAGHLKSWCNECLNADSLARYHANPEPSKKRSAAWQKRNPERAHAIHVRSVAKNYDRIRERERPRDRIRDKTPKRRKQKRRADATYRKNHAAEIKAYNAAYYAENTEVCIQRIKVSVAKKPEHYDQLHKAAKHRRKVRLVNSGPCEKFTDREIFERDKWTCKLCGNPVDRTLVYPDPFSASLDHVLPIAKGGGHVRANVQCAHLRCNFSKRDRIAAVA